MGLYQIHQSLRGMGEVEVPAPRNGNIPLDAGLLQVHHRHGLGALNHGHGEQRDSHTTVDESRDERKMTAAGGDFGFKSRFRAGISDGVVECKVFGKNDERVSILLICILLHGYFRHSLTWHRGLRVL